MDWFSILKESDFVFQPYNTALGGSDTEGNKDFVNLTAFGRKKPYGKDFPSFVGMEGVKRVLDKDSKFRMVLEEVSDEVENLIINQIVDVAIHESAHRAVTDVGDRKGIKEKTFKIINDYMTGVISALTQKTPMPNIRPVLLRVAKYAELQVLDEAYARTTERDVDDVSLGSIKDFVSGYIPDYIKQFESALRDITNKWSTSWTKRLGKFPNLILLKLKDDMFSIKNVFKEASNRSVEKIKV